MYTSRKPLLTMEKLRKKCCYNHFLHLANLLVAMSFLLHISAVRGLLQDQYVGCFYDKGGKAPQSAISSNDNAMTIEKCIGHCRRRSNTYAGLQNGTACLCLDDYGVELPDNICSITCSGSQSQYCGGTIDQFPAYVVFTVCPIGHYGSACDNACHCKYQVSCDRRTGICPDGCYGNWSGSTCSAKQISDQYVGCYGDNVLRIDFEDRAMDICLLCESNTLNTIESCIELCSLNNYSYAGAQYSYQCFCGESYDRFGRLNETRCATPCSGKTTEICGDSYANSVYSICPVGNFGKRCVGRCNCLGNSRCIYENGYCPFNQCEDGWAGDSCNTRDCTVNNGGCFTNETCSNIDLKYATLSVCRCSTGFQRNKIWKNCTDIDECVRFPSICDSSSDICINTIGSYSCYQTGQSLNTSTMSPSLSSMEICLNSGGSYRCNSKPGVSASCTCEKQGLYSVGVVIVVGIGSAVGSAVIVSLICAGIILIRGKQRKGDRKKSNENIKSRNQAASATKLEDPVPLNDYATLTY